MEAKKMQLSQFLPPELDKLDKKHKRYKASEDMAKKICSDENSKQVKKKSNKKKK